MLSKPEAVLKSFVLVGLLVIVTLSLLEVESLLTLAFVASPTLNNAVM
jgi:hypothetical protein